MFYKVVLLTLSYSHALNICRRRVYAIGTVSVRRPWEMCCVLALPVGGVIFGAPRRQLGMIFEEFLILQAVDRVFSDEPCRVV